MAGDQLHVVAAATEHARILKRARDAGAVLPLLVHIQEDVLVVAEIVAVARGAPVLLGGELLHGLAALHLVKLGSWLGQVCVDATALHIPPHHGAVEVRGDVPPLRGTRMRTANEHARGRRQRLVPHGLATCLSGPGAKVRALRVVDETRLVDARRRRRDLGTAAAGIGRRRPGRRGGGALHGAAAVAAAGHLIQQHLGGLAGDDPIGHGIGVLLVRVADCADPALELDAARCWTTWAASCATVCRSLRPPSTTWLPVA